MLINVKKIPILFSPKTSLITTFSCQIFLTDLKLKLEYSWPSLEFGLWTDFHGMLALTSVYKFVYSQQKCTKSEVCKKLAIPLLPV